MRLSRGKYIAALLLSVAAGSSAQACTIMPDVRTPEQLRQQSSAVQFDKQCRTINIGIFDRDSLGPATNLGNGRIQQVISESDHLVLLGDCNTREVTILLGASTQVGETSCGPVLEFAALTGDESVFDLSQGADLHELEELAAAAGIKNINPNERFFEFAVNYGDIERHEVGSNDRFRMLCGCNIYYPNSVGANQ